MSMKALILAGGKGERMGKITQKIPKPMLRIGRLPILEHQINLLRRYGFSHVYVLTCHLSEVIENYFKNRVTYFKEQRPLGTAGGIKALEKMPRNDFIVLYGDKMLDMDFNRLIAFHKNKKALATLVLHPTDHMADSDLVEIDKDRRITAFHPKPHLQDQYFRNLVNAAVYVLSPRILRYIPRGVKTDFGKDVFPKIVGKEKLYGYLTAEYIKDAGTPVRLKQVREDFQSGKIAGFHRKNKRKAIFIDRDGTINEHPDGVQILGPEDFNLFPDTARAIKKINHSDFLAIVISNQPVVAQKLCSISDVEEIHKKLETLLADEGAKLDAIYYCPHHPDYDIKCSCRKPEIGLVKKAARELNIDLRHSYFIGDSWRDIMCARKAGVTSIGVKTGKGCRGIDIKPDYHLDNLSQAVNFIIKK